MICFFGRRWCCAFGWLLVFILGVPTNAQEPVIAPLDPLKAAEQQNARRQALAEEQTTIERLREEIRVRTEQQAARLDALQAEQLTEAFVEQAELDTSAIQLRQADLQADITNSERRSKELEQRIRELAAREQLLKNPAKEDAENDQRLAQLKQVQQELMQQRIDLELEQQHLGNLRNRLTLTNRRLELAEQWQTRVKQLYLVQQEKSRQEAQADLLKRLDRERQAHLERATDLRQRLQEESDSLSEIRRLWLETNIQGAEEKSQLTQLDIRLAKTAEELVKLEAIADRADTEPKTLQGGLTDLRSLAALTQEASDLLQRKIDLLAQQQQVIERLEVSGSTDNRLKTEAAKVKRDLVAEFGQRLSLSQNQLEQIRALARRLENYYEERLSHDLMLRESLPVSGAELQQLMASIFHSPTVLLHQVRLSVESTLNTLVHTTALRWTILVVLELALVWLVVVTRRAFKANIAKIKARSDGSFFYTVVLTVFQLLRKNLLGIGLAVALAMMVWILQVPQPGLTIIITLVFLWVGIKTPINLAWLLLASPQLPADKQRPHIYRQVFWTLLIGGILAAMTILAHVSALPQTVIGVFDRLFMAYWLWAFIPALRIRRLLVDLLADHYAGFVGFMVFRIATLLVPLSLLVAAGLGLLGYLNLAWSVAWHLMIFLVVLAGWLMVRGLLGDFTVLLKNYAVIHSNYGLLWTQDVINPLHKLFRLVLFLVAWFVLFKLYGLSDESKLVNTVWAVFEYPLFTLGGATITLWGILIVVIVIVLVLWLGQWSRAITYRWLLSNIADLGVRHSLSVFSQYTIVLIGFLITLNIINIDLTTVTVFAGALGVALGFGMQAIANNFISGLLLLIERPLRSGDFVKIGTNEGEITRIGIRSLTVKTWDNMEVIIPNSDVITNSFTNWTHQDKVIRTILMIRVAYTEDPHHARAVMEQVLTDHPSVLANPEFMVMLWEFTDSCLLFRVQYFIDLGKDGLFVVRTQVMFAIWDALRKAGIEIPYAQQDLYIKEWPEAPLPKQDDPDRPEPLGATS